MKSDLHPVIKSLLNRQGLNVPINDGKKISLVLFGGIMAGTAGAGAMVALEELGLSNAFDNIFVVSAGFPNASYLLSKQTKIGTSIYYENLSGYKFINPFKFWRGIQIEKVINAIQNSKPLNVERVISSNTKMHVRVLNTSTNKPEYFNLREFCKNRRDYFKLLRASIALPFFHPIIIKRQNYRDGALSIGGGDILDHFNYAATQEHTDMLVIYNNKKYQLGFSSEKICEISLPWESSRFETKKSILIEECLKAGLCTKQTFGYNDPIKL